MATLIWTVRDGHKQIPAEQGAYVTVPAYVLNTPSGSTCQGIPYCWGGGNGIDTLGIGESFLSAAASGNKTAGNVNCDRDGHTAGTIGLDCSGFVASAYMWSGSKPSTVTLNKFGHSVFTSKLKTMDFLVKPAIDGAEGHVVLLYELSGDQLVTYESCITIVNVEGKVQSRELSLAGMINAGYFARSPFCVVCNKSGHIQKTFSGHTFTCSVCAYYWPEEPHTFSGGVCTVCGFR